jgi:peptide/nickel transport system substrate-binding protein
MMPSRGCARTLPLAFALVSLCGGALAQAYVEPPFLAERVGRKELPPVAERVPKAALVVDLAARGRSIGKSGGEVVSLVGRARDIRYLSASTYARLVGYDEKLALGPDLLAKVDVADEERGARLHAAPSARAPLVGRPPVHGRGLPILLGRLGGEQGPEPRRPS